MNTQEKSTFLSFNLKKKKKSSTIVANITSTLNVNRVSIRLDCDENLLRLRFTFLDVGPPTTVQEEKRLLCCIGRFPVVPCTNHGTCKYFIQQKKKKKNFKIGSYGLFTHLKLFCYKCFQFSAISGIQTDP